MPGLNLSVHLKMHQALQLVICNKTYGAKKDVLLVFAKALITEAKRQTEGTTKKTQLLN